ncbi:MAG: hypothetical protein H7096_10740 [Flavobacterium sp.]|nr:hypothetical protein [Pedobacter sp.]
MARCGFSIEVTGSPEILIEKASLAIAQAGGIFKGREKGGNFSFSTPIGNISGDFFITGQVATFNITNKPFLLGCGRIENELRKYIS